MSDALRPSGSRIDHEAEPDLAQSDNPALQDKADTVLDVAVDVAVDTGFDVLIDTVLGLFD